MACPVCKYYNVADIYKRNNLPYSIFWHNGNTMPCINLVASLCNNCSFIFQKSAYAVEEYDAVMQNVYNFYSMMDNSIRPFPASENSLSHSLKFLTDSLDLSKIKNVLEIGSNRGDFLYHLKLKCNHINVIGVEPSSLDFVGIPTVNAFFSENLFSNKFDLVILRNVLEHIKYPKRFIGDVKKVLAPYGDLFIEVPNIKNDLSEGVEVFIPDHVNYFVSSSLVKLIDEVGMHPAAIRDNSDTPLMLIASKEKSGTPNDLHLDAAGSIEAMISKHRDSISHTCQLVKQHLNEGRKPVFYGSKNAFIWFYAAFANSIGADSIKLADPAVVDDAAERIGKQVNGFFINEFDYVNSIRNQKVLFILCAARGNAEAMIEKIKNADLKDYKIILPWVGEVA
jgi:SAM-dependent methyltransferase